YSHCTFHPPAPSPLSTLSLHDALPISALPVRAHEHIVVPLFQPRLPHHSARFIHLKFRTIQHRLADFTDISDRMRCKPILRIEPDRKSTRLNSSHGSISYAVFCLKKKK